MAWRCERRCFGEMVILEHNCSECRGIRDGVGCACVISRFHGWHDAKVLGKIILRLRVLCHSH